MGKGNMCEKCQKKEATTIFDIKGWRKWTVCDACNQELQTCSKCKQNPATILITDGKGEKIQVCADCSKPQEVKCDDCQREMKKGERLFPDKDEKGKQINICSDCKQKRGDENKPNEDVSKKCQSCQNDIDFTPPMLPEWAMKDGKPIMCRECVQKKLGEERKPNKDKPKIPNKEPSKERKPKPGECCEKCGASSIVHETKTSYTWKRKRYIKHKTDFTREETCWFGLNCPCAREFREANQQTCPQCKKREFPHMKRGWMLDYEIKKAFCSPLCHVTYRELKWEEAQRLTQVEMFPPELDVSVNPGENIDWEREGLKREVLFLRETMRELEASLNNQTNLTPEEQQQSDYLRNLQQNTLRNAESAYQGRYGNLSEDGSDKKGMSGGMIFLLVIGGIALVGGIAYFLTRTNKKEKKERW